MSEEPRRSTFWTDLLHIAVETAVGNVVIAANVFLCHAIGILLGLWLGEWFDSLSDLAARCIITLGMILGGVYMAICDVATPFYVIWRMSKARRDLVRKQLNPLFWGAFSTAMLSILGVVCLQYELGLCGPRAPLLLLAGFHLLLLAPGAGWIIAVAKLKWRERIVDRRKVWRAALFGGILLYVASWWVVAGITFLDRYVYWFPRWIPNEIPYLISACVLYPFALAVGAKMLLRAMEE